MPVAAGDPGNTRRLDRWCAAALVASAALGLSYWLGRSSSVHVISYLWVVACADTIVLVAIAWLLATGRHRDPALAFLVGFSAIAVLDLYVGLSYVIGSTLPFRDVWAWLLAGAIQVAVGLRALAAIAARPRRRVSTSRLLTGVVVLAVFLAVATTYLTDAVEPLTCLALIGAVSAIPVLALRHGESAAPMLRGLAACLFLALAKGLLFGHFAPLGDAAEYAKGLAFAPAVVLLVMFANVVRTRGHDETLARGPVDPNVRR